MWVAMCSANPWKAGKCPRLSTSTQALSVSQEGSALGSRISEEVGPASRKRHSLPSIEPLF